MRQRLYNTHSRWHDMNIVGIDSGVFLNQYEMISVIIPKGVHSIGERAFWRALWSTIVPLWGRKMGIRYFLPIFLHVSEKFRIFAIKQERIPRITCLYLF